MVEGLGGAVVVWRFTGSRIMSQLAERRAQLVVADLFWLPATLPDDAKVSGEASLARRRCPWPGPSGLTRRASTAPGASCWQHGPPGTGNAAARSAVTRPCLPSPLSALVPGSSRPASGHVRCKPDVR